MDHRKLATWETIVLRTWKDRVFLLNYEVHTHINNHGGSIRRSHVSISVSSNSTKVAALSPSFGGLYSAVTSLVLDANVVGYYNLGEIGQVCVPYVKCSETFCYVYVTMQVLTRS